MGRFSKLSLSREKLELKRWIKKYPFLLSTARLYLFLWKEFKLLPYFLLSIPCVILLRAIKPWLVIRLGLLSFHNFGAAWVNEVYLCERKRGLQDNKGVLDVFYTRYGSHYVPCNQVLFEKYHT